MSHFLLRTARLLMTIEGSAKHTGDGDTPHRPSGSPDGHHHPQIEKGLAEGSVGLLGGTVLGISPAWPPPTP
jgi:hypothetical protein